MTTAAVGALAKVDPIKLAIGAVIVLGVVYFLGRKTVTDTRDYVANTVANINEGTSYEGAGVVGTLGHGVNVLTGNWLDNVGGWLGGKVYDWTHKDYKP